MKRYELTDEQWDKIKNYFKNKKGRPYKNLRAPINGIIWISRTGAMWRDLPYTKIPNLKKGINRKHH